MGAVGFFSIINNVMRLVNSLIPVMKFFPFTQPHERDDRLHQFPANCKSIFMFTECHFFIIHIYRYIEIYIYTHTLI